MIQKQNVLITGAYGLIGNLVYARLSMQPDSYAAFGMARRTQPSIRAALPVHTIPVEQLRMADLTDFTAVQRAVEGMDVVVHMAADPDGRTGWSSVLNNNIAGTRNMLEACRLAGVQRVIYASTNQVVFGYRADEPYASLFAGHFDAVAPADIRPIVIPRCRVP